MELEPWEHQLLNLCRMVVKSEDADDHKRRLAEDVVEIARAQNLDLSQPQIVSTLFNPLFEACRSGNLYIIKLFAEAGANLNVLDQEGRSPLYSAISSYLESDDLVKYLLEWGADVNFHSDSRCPLLAAFYCMKRETAKLLINQGADVNNVILPSFCYVESVFTLNANLVMMASGVRFQLTSFTDLVSLSLSILQAGLLPRTFYISGRRFMFEAFRSPELCILWKFQHLCLVLGFKVDRASLDDAIEEINKMIDSTRDPQRVSWMTERLEKISWIRTFQSSPMPLTYLARIGIRRHLTTNKARPSRHINSKIDALPIPQICRDFLLLKHRMIEADNYFTQRLAGPQEGVFAVT